MNYDRIKFILIPAVCYISMAIGYGQVNYSEQRQVMVETQLKARDITDSKTIGAMSRVPREAFVPDDKKPYAYSDGPLSIGEGQIYDPIVKVKTGRSGIGSRNWFRVPGCCTF